MNTGNTFFLNPIILYFPTQQQARESSSSGNHDNKKIVSQFLRIKNSSDNTIAFNVLKPKSSISYEIVPRMGYLPQGAKIKIEIGRDVKTLLKVTSASTEEIIVQIMSSKGRGFFSDIGQASINATSQGEIVHNVDVKTQIVTDKKLLSISPIIEFDSSLQKHDLDSIFAKVDPSTIRFLFPRGGGCNSMQRAFSYKKNPHSVLRLQNLYHSRIAFKVIITHAGTRRYIIKPNEGFIDVGSFREISIFLLAKTIPHGTESCEDKFKILLGPASDVAKGYQGEIRFNCQINAVSPHLIRDDAGPSVVKDERVQTEKDESYFPDTMREKRRESTNNRSVGNNDTNEVMGRNVNGRSVRGSDVSRRSAVEEEETASDMLERLMAERYKETERLESQRTQF